MKQAQVLLSPASPQRPAKSHGQVPVAPKLTELVTAGIVVPWSTSLGSGPRGHERVGSKGEWATRSAAATVRRKF